MSIYADRLSATRTGYPFQRWAESGLKQYTIEACSAFADVFNRLITELKQAGDDASEATKLAAFEKAVIALNTLNTLNTLNEADESLIETGEREDLCELVNAIAMASGLDPAKYGGGEASHHAIPTDKFLSSTDFKHETPFHCILRGSRIHLHLGVLHTCRCKSRQGNRNRAGVRKAL